MTPTKLLEMAAWCEATPGPSAEERQVVIDAYYLIDPHEIRLSEEEKGDSEDRYQRTLRQVRFINYVNTDYTRASLDAAMILVPDGWAFANLCQQDNKHWWCELRRGFQTSYDKTAFGSQLRSASAALAVAAAALRARAADLV